MVSLMNGLSGLGAGIATFAGAAGLEQQKATLQQQGMVLADQLAHASKTAELEQAGTIAAGAAAKANEYALGRLAVTTASAQKVAEISGGYQVQAAGISAGATIGAAKISAGASTTNVAGRSKDVAAEIAARSADVLAQLTQQKPLVQAQVDEATVKVGMAKDEAALAHTSFDISTQIAAETAKPPEQQDKAKLDQLYSQRLQLGMTPDVQAKFLMALDGQIKASQQQLTSLDGAAERLTQQLAGMDIDDKARPEQEAELKNVRAQRDAATANLTLLLRSAQTYLPNAGAKGAAAPAAGAKSLDAIIPAPGAGKPAAAPGAAASTTTPAATTTAPATTPPAPGSAAGPYTLAPAAGTGAYRGQFTVLDAAGKPSGFVGSHTDAAAEVARLNAAAASSWHWPTIHHTPGVMSGVINGNQ